MTDLKKVLVSAYSSIDNAIEQNGEILRFFRDDSRGYRDSRVDHPVIMGGTTFRGLLERHNTIIPARTNIIISSTLSKWSSGKKVSIEKPNPHYFASEHDMVPFIVPVFKTMDQALEYARSIDNRVFIVGGRSTIDTAMPLVNRLEITELHREVQGKNKFPEIDLNEWQEVFREKHYPFSFVTYVRRTTEDKLD